MKRKAMLLLFTALLVFAVPAHADVFLLGFTGFDYESPDASDPDVNGSTYLNVGDGYKAVGFITSVGPLLTPWVDTVTNEYTFYLFNLTVTGHNWDAPNQFLDVQFANNGRGRYYEDDRTSGTPGTYGINPPNASAPSTFIDGIVSLGGKIDNFSLYYDYLANQGGFSGAMTLDEGSNLIYIPVAQRAGWVLGGLAGRPNSTVPTGYDNQISGECRIPNATPTTHTTWGAVKSLYR